MAYRIEAIPMTLSDLHAHLPTESLTECDFSYSCAAVDEISTDRVHPAVVALQ